MRSRIPRIDVLLTDVRNGFVTRDWFRFFSELSSGRSNVRTVLETPATIAAQEASDGVVLACKLTTPALVTVYLPRGTPGDTITIVDATGDAGTNSVNVVPDILDTINGLTVMTLNVNNQSRTITRTESEWVITAGYL